MKLLYGTLAVLFVSSAADAQSELPEGKGKAVVERACSQCHGLEYVTNSHMTKERWTNIVDNMVQRGATLSDEEFDQVIDYLVKHFGRTPPPARSSTSNRLASDVFRMQELIRK